MSDGGKQGPAPADLGALGALGRWGRFCFRHRWPVVGVWIVVIAVLATSASLFGGTLSNAVEIPGTDSQRGQDLLDETFPQVAGNAATLVFAARTGTLVDPASQQAVQAALQGAGDIDGVVSVGNPYQQQGGLINEAQTVAFSNVQFAQQSFDVPQSAIDALESEANAAVAGTPVEVNFTGAVITNNITPDDSLSEIIGLTVALVILLIMLGSAVAAIVPIAMAMVALVAGLSLVYLEADFVNLNTITPTLAIMLGLGVGIDYSLFLITRYRQELAAGREVADAVAIATATGGRAVIFAGTMVVLSVASLVVFGLSWMTLIGVGAAVTVVTAVIAANSLVPAALSILGHHVNSLRLPHFRHPREDDDGGAIGAWGRLVTRRSLIFGPLALVVLLVLALPVFWVQLGASDAGTYPKGQTERTAYDQISTAFGPGFNGPLVVSINQSADPQVTDRIASAIQGTDGVATVQAPVVNQQGTTAVLSVIPTSSPQSRDTVDLVDTLRDDVIPGAIGGADATAYVGGTTAAFDDIATRIGDRLVWFVLLAGGIVLLIMTTAFRSLSVGVKAFATMLLSAAASFGVLIAVFQFGWGLELIGLDQTGPITSYLPPIVFAILFGLSMDYEVFLVSRIREEFVRGASAPDAITQGVARIGKVVVAAALIMTSVFLSFLLSDSSLVKQFGLALGVSILIDAFIVRLTLVPAVMQVLGERMWWIPRWLDRILPPLTIEPSFDSRAEDDPTVPPRTD